MHKPLATRMSQDDIRAHISYGNRDGHPDTQAPMDPWTVVLECGPRKMTISWWTGISLTADPTAQDVLEYLLRDAVSIEGSQSFAQWSAGREASRGQRADERTYRAQVRQTERLRELLGAHYASYLTIYDRS